MSGAALKGVDRNVTVDLVQARPESFTGRKVVWGGLIIGTENLENKSEVEVMETELAFDDVPENENSRGRFIIESAKFLDSGIYKAGRLITVVGTVKGSTVKKIGKMDYTYPVLDPVEIRIFEPVKKVYDPYWPHDPLYRPYGPHLPYDPYWPYPPAVPYNPAWPYPYRYPY